MHLLYLDDSGSVQNASDRHIILAGLSVYERQPYWLCRELDTLAANIWPQGPEELEFRGADIIAGKKQWRAIPRAKRIEAYKTALGVLGTSQHVRLFGAAIHKAAVSPDDPMEYAFEALCNRFDRFLGRLHKRNDTQRGLIVLDKSSYETSLQTLSTEFRTIGHRWGELHNISEVPLFVDSRATRMIQFADLIAHSLRRYFEHGEPAYFDSISGKFDTEGGVLHGLVHRIPDNFDCNCHACRLKKRFNGPLQANGSL